jgi:cobalt/nickel transport protein
MRPALTVVVLALLAPAARAHYNILLPNKASVKKGQPVTFRYQWGHPFEHQLFNAPKPRRVWVMAPDGKKTNLSGALAKITVQVKKDKPVTAYRLRFTPTKRGDYFFLLTTDPIWMKEEKLFYQDTVKVVLHVEDQDGWDNKAGEALELLPLTRPYGLQAGMVFQAQTIFDGKATAGTLVEIEPYHAKPPKELPADEQMTRTAKTDPNGVVTCTLTEAGWWGLTARRKIGLKKHQSKSYPVWQRTTLWVYVDPKLKPAK